MRSIGYSLVGLVGALVLSVTARPAFADLTVQFVNDNPDYTTSNVYVTFGNAANDTFSATANGAALVKGTSYSLAQLASGVTISDFPSGRIFVSLGAPLTTATSATGYAPNFNNPTLGDFDTRWDKVEITYTGGAGGSGGANLSSQDFFSVPLRVSTSGGGVQPTTLTWNASTASVMQNLGQLSQFSIDSTTDTSGAVVVASAPGAKGVSVPGVSEPVVRIISPATVAPTPDNGTVYPSLQPYLKTIQDDAIATTIEGSNGLSTGSLPQVYDFTATIANSTETIGTDSVVPGDLLLSGTITNGSEAPLATSAIVAATSLTDTGIYGANVPFSIAQGADTNGAITRAVADYLAGVNFGFIGSTEALPGDPSATIGNSPSWEWYGNNPNGIAQTPLPISDAFARAQPNHPDFYNSYAGYLVNVTDAYGFAYNDRLQSPLASLGADTTMTVTVLPDSASPSPKQSVPEPGSLALLGTALIAFGAFGRGARRRRIV